MLFLDSGLGCLPYGRFFHSRNRSEKLVCVADRANFPYGKKSRETLAGLLDSLAAGIVSRYDPKVLAIACNTASVSALDFLRERHPSLPIVGTVPAVKPAAENSKTRRIGVLGTERTVDDPYIMELAGRFGPDCAVLREAAPELVEYAEHCYGTSTQAERLQAVGPYIEKFRRAGADSIVLGCTHYLLLLDDFRLAAGKDMAVYGSVEGVSRRVESIMDEGGGELRAGMGAYPGVPAVLLTGEGEPEPYWRILARRFGFSLGRFP